MSDDDILTALSSPSKHLYVHKRQIESVYVYSSMRDMLHVNVGIVTEDNTGRCWHMITDTTLGLTHPSLSLLHMGASQELFYRKNERGVVGLISHLLLFELNKIKKQ